MAGTIIADTWQNGDGTQNYKCRAWVNFNGTGTVGIRASGNVSSVTDNGVGSYGVNLITAMPDTNYAAFMNGKPGIDAILCNYMAPDTYGVSTTSTVYIRATITNGPMGYDHPIVTCHIFR